MYITDRRTDDVVVVAIVKTEANDARAFVEVPMQLVEEQGHHHSGGQAAQQLCIMCSICGRRFATPSFGVRGGRGWAY